MILLLTSNVFSPIPKKYDLAISRYLRKYQGVEELLPYKMYLATFEIFTKGYLILRKNSSKGDQPWKDMGVLVVIILSKTVGIIGIKKIKRTHLKSKYCRRSSLSKDE